MKKTITKMLLTLIIIGAVQLCNAQYTVNQVIVLNQGTYGQTVPVTIGSYKPVTKLYQNFDNIPQARFSSYVIIDNGFIYAAADSFLIKYDLNTKQRLYMKTVQGIREIAVWNNQLLVTRGQTGPLPSYFQVYGKDSLNFIYELPSVSQRAEGIKVLNDTAYVAINGFGTVGKLAIIDLNNHLENREIDFGPNGLNPYNVEVEPANGTIYTVNNMDYTNASITKYNVNTCTFVTTLLNQANGCNGSTYYLNNVYFQMSGKTNIGEFSTSSLTVWDSLQINKPLLGIAIDSVNSNFYVGNTDFATYGEVYIYNLYGTVQDSFAVGIAPGNFAFDVRSSSGINQVNDEAKVSVYPNPSHDFVTINYTRINQNETITVQVIDVLGNIVETIKGTPNSVHTISLQNFSSGIYSLKVTSDKAVTMAKLVKE